MLIVETVRQNRCNSSFSYDHLKNDKNETRFGDQNEIREKPHNVSNPAEATERGLQAMAVITLFWYISYAIY